MRLIDADDIYKKINDVYEVEPNTLDGKAQCLALGWAMEQIEKAPTVFGLEILDKKIDGRKCRIFVRKEDE